MKKAIRAYGGKGLSVVYAFGDGKGVMRCGGDIGWRSTNPGNINTGKNSKEYGSIGNNGRFAIFPDFETGKQAIVKLLRKNYLHYTLEQAFYIYAPPEENNTEKYIAFILAKTGYRRDDLMKHLNLRPIVEAIIIWEGYWKGKGKVIELNTLNPSYTWRTRKDLNVRDEHKIREGMSFEWDTPPSDGHPGEAFGCRCWAEAHEYHCVENINAWPVNHGFKIQIVTT
jgi:hypothetical protein